MGSVRAAQATLFGRLESLPREHTVIAEAAKHSHLSGLRDPPRKQQPCNKAKFPRRPAPFPKGKYLFRSRLVFSIAAVACLPAAVQLQAQVNAVDGAVEGYVHDAQGGAVEAAQVTLFNIGTGVTQEAVTDTGGYYRFPLAPVGQYRIGISKPGFNTYTQTGLTISVGQTGRVDAALAVGSESQTVQVTANTPLTDTADSTVGAVLGEKEIEELPIVSRNVFNFQLFSPGVIGLPTSTFSTTQFTFGGSERSQWQLDGLDNTQHGGNRQIRLVIVTPEAVAQTQTLASGYPAEFGRAAGGQESVIIRSGTNDLHGSALFQYRPFSLQAIPTLATLHPSRTWYDGAATLGGPVLRDRLFFFGQFEQNPYTSPSPIVITAANAQALGLAASQLGDVPFGEDYRTITGKVNYVLGSRNTGYLRFNRFTNNQPNTSGGLSVSNRGTIYTDHMNGGGAQLATAINSNLLNEARFGVSQRDTQNLPYLVTDPNSVNINISGVANIGYDPLNSSSTTERAIDGVDNLTWTRGRSTLKFGTELERITFQSLSAIDRTYTFAGLPATNDRAAVTPLNQYLNTKSGTVDPATGQPYTYTQFTTNGGDPRLKASFNFLNFFAQDEFRPSPNLLINAGLRYEAILFPVFNAQSPLAQSRTVPNDWTDIAPRFAFTWSPGSRQSTVIRGAYGMYYDVPGLSIFYGAAQNNGLTFLSYLVKGGTAGAPTFPNAPDLTGSAFKVKPSVNIFDPNFHDTYQHQANLQVQQQLGRNTLLTAGYLFAAQRHGLYVVDTNLGAQVRQLADGRPVYGGTAARPNTSFNQINSVRAGAATNFNGGFVSLSHRLSSGVEFGANYTYSHALANNLGEGGQIEDPSNPSRDYGDADDDVRHNLTVQALYDLPGAGGRWQWTRGFELSTLYFYNSGFPINPVAGTDLNNDGVLNDRPLFVARNSFRGRYLSQLDGQAMRNFTVHDRFHLTAFAAAENLLNTNNLNCNTTSGCTGAVINNVNAPDFGREVSARTSRNVQVGVKAIF